jgi:hypothetical protein
MKPPGEHHWYGRPYQWPSVPIGSAFVGSVSTVVSPWFGSAHR